MGLKCTSKAREFEDCWQQALQLLLCSCPRAKRVGDPPRVTALAGIPLEACQRHVMKATGEASGGRPARQSREAALAAERSEP